MKSFSFFWKLGGGFIIFTIIYIRFIRSRATGPIDLTYTEVKFYLYIWLIFTFSLVLVGIIILPIYLRYFGRRAESKNTLFSRIQFSIHKILAFIHETYEKMIEAFYLPLLQKHLEKYRTLWYTITRYIYSLRLKFIFRFFYFLPPAIISLTYLIEVIIYHEFTYFPYVIFLMIFPIGIRVLMYNIQQYILNMLSCSNDIIIMKTTEDGRIAFSFTDYIPIEKQTEEYLAMFVEAHIEMLHWEKLFEHSRKYFIFSNEKTFFQIFSLLCWISSFSFLLYLILLNK